MPALSLIVMAAGIGSRYGGLKQIDPVGPSGEIVIDYSIYDALLAGFERMVFVIRKDIEDAFRDQIGKTAERRADVVYVFQSLGQVPAGFRVPPGRVKPWGTGQAILACREAVAGPFAAINADDFYGRTTYTAMAAFLKKARAEGGVFSYAMAGFTLANTLSEHGHVARGICEPGPGGYLKDIRERLRIELRPEGIYDLDASPGEAILSPDTLVSMNYWGFRPSLFGELEDRFGRFLRTGGAKSPKAEFLIPEIIGHLVREGRARVKILPTAEKWFGVTYPEDKPRAQAAVRELVRRGQYPENLWGL